MSAPLEKIRKQAAQYEHDRQYDRALACYARLLDATAEGDDTDIALFNRAGDVAVRAGQVERAVQYFESALDRYAAGGLLNNAIAVGVKVLRHAPTHVAAHYTLGVLYAKKGFRSDARHHLLAYALRMQRGGSEAEVTRALADFVALADTADTARAELTQHLAGVEPQDADAGAALTRTLDRTLASLVLADVTPRGGALDASAPPANLVFLDVGLGEPTPPSPALTPGFEPTALAASDRSSPQPTPSRTRTWRSSRWPSRPRSPGEPAPMTIDWLDHAPAETVAEAPALDVESPASDVALLDAPVAFDDLLLLEAPDAMAGEAYPGADAAIDFTMVDAGAGLAADAGDDAGDEPSTSPRRAFLDLPLLDDASQDGAGTTTLDFLAVDEPMGAPGDAATQPSVVAASSGAAPLGADDDGLDLGDWLRASEPAPTTRMTARAPQQTEDEDLAFADALRAFKAGVARSVPEADYDSHYDLGIAYREMGLLDEAIGALQKAARAPAGRSARSKRSDSASSIAASPRSRWLRSTAWRATWRPAAAPTRRRP
jgi:tetratricopeptide (TPR) repeat protein